jgi:hypothetical protein
MCPSLYFFLVRVNVFMPDSRFIRPLKNGDLPRQRKNPDRASAQYTARPGFFRFLAPHHF